MSYKRKPIFGFCLTEYYKRKGCQKEQYSHFCWFASMVKAGGVAQLTNAKKSTLDDFNWYLINL